VYEIQVPAEVIWWEDPTTADEEHDLVELGQRVAWLFACPIEWTWQPGLGWIDAAG